VTGRDTRKREKKAKRTGQEVSTGETVTLNSLPAEIAIKQFATVCGPPWLAATLCGNLPFPATAAKSTIAMLDDHNEGFKTSLPDAHNRKRRLLASPLECSPKPHGLTVSASLSL